MLAFITTFSNNKKRYLIIVVVWLQKFIRTFLQLCGQSQKKENTGKQGQQQEQQHRACSQVSAAQLSAGSHRQRGGHRCTPRGSSYTSAFASWRTGRRALQQRKEKTTRYTCYTRDSQRLPLSQHAQYITYI